MTDKLERIRFENMKERGFGIERMKQIKVCTRCGNTSEEKKQFCTECNHRLPDKTLYDIYKERHKTCPHCDTVVSNETDYCPQCGTKIETRKLNDTQKEDNLWDF